MAGNILWKFWLVCNYALLLLPLWNQPCLADTYIYTNREGTVVMTDSRESIPKAYQKKVRVQRDPAPARQVSAPVSSSSAAEGDNGTVKESPELPWQAKYGPIAVYTAAIVVFFYLVRKFSIILGHPKLGLLFFIIVSIAAGVYFYRTYVDRLSETFHVLKQDAEKIKKNVENRETMTEKSLQGVKE